MSVTALVPVKEFAGAKRRLLTLLSTTQCAELAAAMAGDVLTAIRESTRTSRCIVVGGEDARALAKQFSCEWRNDEGANDLNAALSAAATGIEGTLLVLPADLPELRGADIDELLENHRGVTVCSASRDGGTNALVCTPPGIIPFQFGANSAQRHLQCARDSAATTRHAELAAFRCDIDTADDLLTLRCAREETRTARWLATSNIIPRQPDGQHRIMANQS